METTPRPLLLYAVPLFATFVVTLSLFLGQGDQVTAARLIGGPTDDEAAFRGRVQYIAEVATVIEPQEDAELFLRSEQGPLTSERSLHTGEDGWVEFSIKRAPAAPLHLRLSDASGKILVEGTPQFLSQDFALNAVRRRSGTQGHQSGALAACVDVEKGVLAVPFAAKIKVRVYRSELPELDKNNFDCSLATKSHHYRPASGAEIQVSAQGADILGEGKAQASKDGETQFELRPNRHSVRLEVSVRSENDSFSFSDFPLVVPGANWVSELSPKGDKRIFELSSPVARSAIWYTFVSERSRGPGGVVPLRELANGSSVGQLSVDKESVADFTHIVLASDADGRSSSAVGYPLAAQGYTLDVWDRYLLDGLPQARALQKARGRRVRIGLFAYAAASLLITVVLFLAYVRQAARELDVKMRQAGAGAETYGGRSAAIFVAVLCVFFAFSATLVWMVAR